MTKEQVDKHKGVIRWWLDNTDKGVWVKTHKEGKWSLEYEPTFTINITIQNDEYAELRKAQADGKIIELQCKTGGDKSKWLIKTKTTRDFNEGYFYRIKPDEPKFKKGDWVKDVNGNIFNLSEAHICNYTKDSSYLADCIIINVDFSIGQWVTYDYSKPILLNETNLREYLNSEVNLVLWQPQEGDVVIVWSNEDKLRLVVKANKDMSFKLAGEYYNINMFDNVIPYIGQDFKDML